MADLYETTTLQADVAGDMIQGDAGEAYADHLRTALRYAHHITGDDYHAAQEAAQKAVVGYWEASQKQSIQFPEAYIVRSVRNAALTGYSEQKRRIPYAEPWAATGAQEPPQPPGPAAIVIHKEALVRALSTLHTAVEGDEISPQAFTAFRMHIEGASPSEVGDALGLSANAVAAQIYRVRVKIKSQLTDMRDAPKMAQDSVAPSYEELSAWAHGRARDLVSEDPHAAQDIAQHALFSLLRIKGGTASPKRYLFDTMRKAASRERARREWLMLHPDPQSIYEESAIPSVPDYAEEYSMRAHVQTICETLSPRASQVMKLSLLEDMSPAIIADMLHITRESVSRHIQFGTVKLQRHLNKIKSEKDLVI